MARRKGRSCVRTVSRASALPLRRYEVTLFTMKAARKGPTAGARKGTPQRGYLDGQMLIAMPSMRDERFARTLIYVCAHSSEGAMGIVVNQPAANIKFPDLLVQLDVISDTDLIQLPPAPAPCRCSRADRSSPAAGSCCIR